MIRWIEIACALFPLAILAGCSSTPTDKQYDVKGRVISIDAGGKSIYLDHEEIPSLLRPMKSPFFVEGVKMLDGLSPGDKVEGKLTVVHGKSVFTELRKKSEDDDTKADKAKK